MLVRHAASRYVQPLREGGSLPAVVDTEDGGLWVVKFRGAGQGAKVLIAELIVGGLAKALGLPTPELAIVDVSPRFGRSEPDPEIQELLRRSHGVNVGLRYLDGAFNFDPSAAGDLVTPELAARTVWLDALTTNPDRTHRNPNIMIWRRTPWLIDHGAALYAHHDWSSVDETRTRTPFPLIRSHVLLSAAGDLAEADAHGAERLGGDTIACIVADVPDELLTDTVAGTGDFPTAEAARARYTRYLEERLAARHAWRAEAEAAQEQVRLEPPLHLKARR
ncbi:MAG: HipA family kinase [bacterium]